MIEGDSVPVLRVRHDRDRVRRIELGRGRMEAVGLDDPDLRRKAGESGRERVVAGYSIKSVLPTYLEIFERVSRSR